MDYDRDDSERSIHFGKSPRKIYISRSFPKNNPEARQMRYVSRVIEPHDPGIAYATVESETVLRRTAAGRFEIRATVFEDDRSIKSLTIQRFSNSSGPDEKYHFHFSGQSLDLVMQMFERIKTAPMAHSEKIHLTASEIGDVVLDQRQAQRLLANHQDLFIEAARNGVLKKDIIALGYRRKQLEVFENLLTDPDYFAAEERRQGKTGELLWQAFFEANTWIFGYGLCYQFLGSIDKGKLERYVVGSDIGGAGKRADAVMKTQARINSLCFVEIKKHDEPLMQANAYRREVWAPGKELSGGVAQVQATIHSTIERYARKVEVVDDFGEPQGAPLFNFDPRGFLVIGNLDEFCRSEGRINETKLRSFELYRRSIHRPEIVTYDELLNRARFIIECDGMSDDEPDLDDDVPF
jgi:hypothetical protein